MQEEELLLEQLNSSLHCTIRPLDGIESEKIVKVSATLKRNRVQCSSAFFNYSTPIPYQNYTLEFSKANEMIDKTLGLKFFFLKTVI